MLVIVTALQYVLVTVAEVYSFNETEFGWCAELYRLRYEATLIAVVNLNILYFLPM